MRHAITALFALTALLGSLAAAPGPGAPTPATPRTVAAGGQTITLVSATFDPLTGGAPVPDEIGTVEPADLEADVARAWLFQLHADADPATFLTAADAAGIVVADYLPTRTYSALVTPVQADVLATATSTVRWYGLLQPGWKLRTGGTGPLSQAGTQRLRVVGYRHDPRTATLDDALASLPGVEVVATGSTITTVEATAGAVPDIVRLAQVQWVELEPTYVLHNAAARWVNDTGRRQVYEATAPGRLTGAGLVTAASDTGLNYIDTLGPAQRSFSECDAAGCKRADLELATPGDSVEAIENIKDNRAEDGLAPHRKMLAYFDLGVAGAAPFDASGHGTHVAGSVTGDTDRQGTWDRHDGMAPAARHVHQNVATTSGSLGGLPSDHYDLLKLAYRPEDPGSVVEGGDAEQRLADRAAYEPGRHARTHNYSIGSLIPLVDAFSDTFRLDQFVWDHEDWVDVVSAGNSGPRPGTVSAPNLAKNDFTSAASANGDQPMVSPHSLAVFSSHGPTADGRYGVDLATPGQIVVSTKGGSEDDAHYLQGTSMSAPILTGLATLTRQYFCDGYGPADGRGVADGTVDARVADTGECVHNPSAALVRAALANGAQRMRGWYTGDDGTTRALDGQYPSAGQGFGLVNLANSLQFEDDDRHAAFFDVWRDDEEAFPVGLGQSWSTTVTVAEGQPLDVTLSWTDAPTPIEVGTPVLVNDLHLVVEGPDGTRVGNAFDTRLDPGAEEAETPAGAIVLDTVNNTEKVRIPAPVAGEYTITVEAPAVFVGPQGFGVAVGGDLTGTPDAPALGAGTFADSPGTPEIGGVAVDRRSGDTSVLTFRTSELTTAEVEIAGTTYVSEIDAGEDGFVGLDTGPVETSPDTGGVPWTTRDHKVWLTGLEAGTAVDATITAVDLAGNEVTTTTTFTTPTAAFQAAAPDIGQLAEAQDLPTNAFLGTPGWKTGTQLYAGPIAGLLGTPVLEDALLGAFMFRIPEQVDPAAVRGAYVELISGHMLTSFYLDRTGEGEVPPEPAFIVDLLSEDVEAGWGTQGYQEIRNAEALTTTVPVTGFFVGGGRSYRFAVGCDGLDALRSSLETVTDGERRLPFRILNTIQEEDITSLPGFEFGFNRRSRGPDLRPRLVLLVDDGSGGLRHVDATSATAPAIDDVRVQPVREHEDGSVDVAVTWRTDVASDSTVLVRRSDGTVDEIANPAPARLHLVEVRGVDPDGDESFAVVSASRGGQTLDDNAGTGYGFFPQLGVEAEPTRFVDHELYDFNDGLQGWTPSQEGEGATPLPDDTSDWEHDPNGGPEGDGAPAVMPYLSESKAILTAPAPVTFEAGGIAQVQFDGYIDTEDTFDPLLVEHSVDGGESWVRAAAFFTRSPEWKSYLVDLEDAAGQDTLVRFVLDSDANLDSTTGDGEGVAIDNVLLRSGVDLTEAEEGDPVFFGADPAPPADGPGFSLPTDFGSAPDDAEVAAGTARCVQAAAVEAPPAPEPPMPATGGGAALAGLVLAGAGGVLLRRRGQG